MDTSGQKNPAPHTPPEPQDKGVKGWLMLYAVGLVLTAGNIIIGLLDYPSVFTDMEPMQLDAPDLYAAITSVLWLEIILNAAALGLGITTLIQLLRQKRHTPALAIAYMLLLVASTLLSYGMVNAIAGDYPDIDFSEALNVGSTDAIRNAVYAAVWIPYFVTSKRVKATLVK